MVRLYGCWGFCCACTIGLALAGCDDSDTTGTAGQGGTAGSAGAGAAAGTGGSGQGGSGGAAPAGCGNGQTDPGEACDGADVNGYQCSDLPGFASGTLGCRADCLSYDVAACVAGSTRDAASCSQADVESAVAAASDGDTVRVPAGTCTWDAQTSISDQHVTLQGAGIGNTTIIIETPVAGNWSALGIANADKPARVTGFTFRRVASTAPGDVWANMVAISGVNWRVDHCRFEVTGSGARGVYATTDGLVDHCEFEELDDVQSQGVRIYHTNDNWTLPLDLGTARATVIEDTTFLFFSEHDSAVDGCRGARVVFRHNSVTNTEFQLHGLWSCGDDMAGALSYEVYDNAFIADMGGTYVSAGITLRGGTGALFNNTFTGLFSVTMHGRNYRSCQDGPWGLCDGTNPIDGNLEPNGYPCRDQIGRAADLDEDGVQEAEPLYEWNNTFDGAATELTIDMCPQSIEHIQQGRDYYTATERPGYVPYVYPHPLTQLAP